MLLVACGWFVVSAAAAGALAIVQCNRCGCLSNNRNVADLRIDFRNDFWPLARLLSGQEMVVDTRTYCRPVGDLACG